MVADEIGSEVVVDVGVDVDVDVDVGVEVGGKEDDLEGVMMECLVAGVLTRGIRFGGADGVFSTGEANFMSNRTPLA